MEFHICITAQAKNSNFRHRPIGIGVQGLADAFARMRLAFECPAAMQLNKGKSIQRIMCRICRCVITSCVRTLMERRLSDVLNAHPRSKPQQTTPPSSHVIPNPHTFSPPSFPSLLLSLRYLRNDVLCIPGGLHGTREGGRSVQHVRGQTHVQGSYTTG